jgi:hypothetical protein
VHALNRRDYTMPVITENYLRRPADDELGSLAIMPCVLLALPKPALPFMAGVHDTGKPTGDRPPRNAPGQEHSGIWLRNAAAGLGLLAAAAAVVSFTAQYRLVYATRRLAVVAGLEAAIPDAAALVFACLGIALALHGRRAIRPRILNLASVGTSAFMNTIAAAPGWRNLAVWAMPPVAYGLASDTLKRGGAGGGRPPSGPGRCPGPGGDDAAGRGRRASTGAKAQTGSCRHDDSVARRASSGTVGPFSPGIMIPAER